jgi:hypothetical protein
MANAGQANFNDKIILNANKVIEFGDSGETISGDGTNLTIASSGKTIVDSTGDIELDASSGIVDFISNGTVFGNVAASSDNFTINARVNNKDISFTGLDDFSTITALTLDMSEAGAATFNDKIILGANKSIEFGDSGETITGDGTNLTILSSGYMEVKSAGNLLLDSTGGSILLRDTTLNLLQISKSGSVDAVIKQPQSDGDLLIKGNDGGSEITALTLDMSEAGAAAFNSTITADSGKDVILGKFEGSNFANSILIGHSDSGSLNNAQGNVGVGITALDALVTADNNVAVGFGALSANASGNSNTALGQDSLAVNNSGAENTAVGSRSSYLLANGTGNTTIGFKAGEQMNNADADYNILIGHQAGDNITEGAGNVIIGSVDAAAADGDRTLKIAGYDGSSTTTWISGDSAGALTFADKVVLAANKTIEFGDSGETISGDGTDLTIASSRHIKFDATNDITLDAGAGGLKFDDDGATIGLLFNASGDLTFKIVQQDKDLNIKGNDGGSEITALTLDMSAAGSATFNHDLFLSDTSGRIGLGTTSPVRSIEVSQAIPAIRMTDTDSAAGYMELKGAGPAFEFTLDPDNALSSSAMSFKVDNTEYVKMRDSRIEILDGTATFPAITNLGDVQTGLFFSAAGTMAFTSAGTSQFTMTDGAIAPVTDSDVDLGTTSLRFKDAFVDSLTADGGLKADNITIDGTEIDLSSGDLTLDVAGDIILNADGGDWIFRDGSTELLKIFNASSDVSIKAQVQDKDLKFLGNDGGSGITALTLDMSAAGNAYFNNNIIIAKDADATNNKILLGAAADGESGDLEVYHDGNHSHIRDRSTGNLRLRSTKIVLASDSMSYLEATNAGSVDIYHNSSKKFETTSAGATVTGGLKISDDGTIGNTTTANAMTIEAAGQVTFVGDIGVGDDIFMGTNGALISMGAANISRIIHQSDGFIFKSLDTGDDNPFVLTLQTGETDIAANDVLGKIDFQAPDEGTGTDAILVAAGIEAVSEGDFSSSSNATKLSFKTAASEAASEKMSLSSAGNLTVSGTVTANGEVLTAGVSAGFAVAMAIAL